MKSRTTRFELGETYQVSDLAKRRVEVVAQARRGGALVRDKDGTALLLALADDVFRDHNLALLAGDYLRVLGGNVSDSAYGSLSWLTMLDEEDRAAFVEELRVPLLIALSGGPTEPVTEIIEDWRATAAVWADEDLRRELSHALTKPLHNVKL
jgi:hypothetical protein